MKVESSWGHGRQSVVRCIARLTRSLTSREQQHMRLLVPVEEEGRGDRITWFCRPEEVEPIAERVGMALELVTRRRPARTRRSRLRLSG